jgi:FG-GAP-like repeat/PASTA domain
MLRSGKLVTHSMDRRLKGWSGRRRARGCALLFACVGLALTLGVAALSAADGPSFAHPQRYAIGSWPNSNGPRAVAIGDLNGDAKPELATANSTRTVSVLVNKGDGSFKARRKYPAGRGATSIAIGDLNGDGKLDLATGNYDNSVSVLLNRGDGSFQAKRDYGVGRHPYSIAIRDLNSDSKQDIATANYDAKSVSVLLNTGDGSFRANRDYRTGSRPLSVAIGDLNSDGTPDLATANSYSKSVSVLLNRGDGSFQARLDHRAGAWPLSVAIGDLNGDGKLDLATGNSKTVSVLLNKGDGSFRAKRNYGSGGGGVAIGDLNGDGTPDLVTAHPFVTYYSGTGAVSVLVNRGDGRFRFRLDYATADIVPYSVAIGDLNGDGRPDLASAHPEAFSVSVLLNRPGMCTVQNVAYLRVVVGLHDPDVTIVGGMTLSAARRTIASANCRVGKISHAYSKVVRRGRVVAQKPKFGTVLPGGGQVNLVLSRGRKH